MANEHATNIKSKKAIVDELIEAMTAKLKEGSPYDVNRLMAAGIRLLGPDHPAVDAANNAFYRRESPTEIPAPVCPICRGRGYVEATMTSSGPVRMGCSCLRDRERAVE